jgi:hypothetical protein
MAQRSTRIALALLSVLTVTATGARAQDGKASQPAEPIVFGTDATYEVMFDDDPLAAIPNGTIIPRITGNRKWPHASLMRPRTQFVIEMLKSSDKL